MDTQIEVFDIVQLRNWFNCQSTPYVGGQRMPGGVLAILERFPAILNALALYQGQSDLVVDLPAPPAPEPPKENRHVVAQRERLKAEEADEVGPVFDEVLGGTESPESPVEI